MTKELVLKSVKDSVSSIFSKEDVITLINSIEGKGILVEDIQRAIENILDWAENSPNQIVDVEAIEFELAYENRLVICHTPIQLENLKDALESNFMDLSDEYFLRPVDEERDDE